MPIDNAEEHRVRFQGAIQHLAQRVWRLNEPLPIEATEPTRETLPFPEGTARPTKPLGDPPVFWGKMFDQRWCAITLPRPTAEGDWLAWRGQGETTVYVDGRPIGGTDASRSRVRLPTGAAELWIEWVAENAGIWAAAGETMDEHGCRFEGAFLARRDDTAWRCGVDLEIVRDLIELEIARSGGPARPLFPWGVRPRLDRLSPLGRTLLAGGARAIDALDRDGPGACEQELRSLFASLPGGDPLFEVVLTGHAHIDLVWRWPERTGEFKAVHTFANAVGLAERDRRFRFAYSQPASYEAVSRRSPELFERVRSLIKEGRWEAAGMLYVESDTQLPCGESLARSFLIGQQGFEEITGSPSRVLWLPDCFGFSACVPQLALEAGGEAFFSTKTHWSTTTRFPFAAFVWRGGDGSELVGFVPGDFDYNGDASVQRVTQAASQQRQSAVFGASLVPTGFGDGGGGPTEEMCRRAEVMSDVAGLPRVRWGGVGGFFDGLRERKDQLPVWSGEIYLEYHRGVQTTGRRLKAAFRAAERGMQAWEAAAVVRAAGPVDRAVWKRVVFSQFHDYVPGSSIGEVYAEHIPELERIAARATDAAASTLAADVGRPCLFNPIAIERVCAVRGEIHRLAPLRGELAENTLLSLPAPAATERELASDRVRATLDERGLLASLEIDGEPIPLRPGAAGVSCFADRAHAFEAWDIDRAALANPIEPSDVSVHVSVTVSPTLAEVIVTTGLSRSGRVTTRYSVTPGEPALRITYAIELDEPDRLVQAHFPVSLDTSRVRYGQPFASVTRGHRSGLPAEEARFEVPASRWASVESSGGVGSGGVGLVSESSYGFGACERGLHVSLLRTALVTNSGFLRDLRRDDAGPSHFDTEGATVRLAIGRGGAAALLSETLYAPVIPYRGEPLSAGFRGLAGDANVIPAWVKPAESGGRAWILRLHEIRGHAGTVSIELDDGWEAFRTDLREVVADPLEGGRSFALRANAFGSVLIRPR